jgi:transcriptional regulator with XRE-family HTH domain
MIDRETRTLAHATLADALRRYQQLHDLTFKALGEQLGVTEQYVAKLIAGRGWPSAELLVRMRRLRVIDVNAVLDDVPAPEREAA